MSLNVFAIFLNTKLIPLLLAIFGFGLLITVHELGHFIFCKIFNIYTPTFSIGIGPKIIEKKIGSTNFRLSAIPLGGYVEIAGLAEAGGQGEQKLATMKGDGSFADKPFWQKALVLLGGIIFNLLFAYTAFSFVYFYGIPKQTANISISTKINKGFQEKYNLKPEDNIISINSETLSTNPKELVPVIQKQFMDLSKKTTEPETLNIIVLRDNKEINLSLKLETEKEKDAFMASIELKSTPIVGEYERYPLFSAISKGIHVTNQWAYQIVYGIKYLITQKTLKGAGGPIMILSKTFETAQKGFLPLLVFLAIISVNLAIINLLPIGALDGGQLLFTTIEAIIRRPIPEIIKVGVNIASWVLILGLILYLSYKDLMLLIFNQ